MRKEVKRKSIRELLKNLPFECMGKCISFIHTKDLLGYRLIDKNWNEAICHPFSWTYRTLTFFPVGKRRYAHNEIKNKEKSKSLEEEVGDFFHKINPVKVSNVSYVYSFLFRDQGENNLSRRLSKIKFDFKEKYPESIQNFEHFFNENQKQLSRLEIWNIVNWEKFLNNITPFIPILKNLKTLILGTKDYGLSFELNTDFLDQLYRIEELQLLNFIKIRHSSTETSNKFNGNLKKLTLKYFGMFSPEVINDLEYFNKIHQDLHSLSIVSNGVREFSFDINICLQKKLFPNLETISLENKKFRKINNYWNRNTETYPNYNFQFSKIFAFDKLKYYQTNFGRFGKSLKNLESIKLLHHEKPFVLNFLMPNKEDDESEPYAVKTLSLGGFDPQRRTGDIPNELKVGFGPDNLIRFQNLEKLELNYMGFRRLEIIENFLFPLPQLKQLSLYGHFYSFVTPILKTKKKSKKFEKKLLDKLKICFYSNQFPGNIRTVVQKWMNELDLYFDVSKLSIILFSGYKALFDAIIGFLKLKKFQKTKKIRIKIDEKFEGQEELSTLQKLNFQNRSAPCYLKIMDCRVSNFAQYNETLLERKIKSEYFKLLKIKYGNTVPKLNPNNKDQNKEKKRKVKAKRYLYDFQVVSKYVEMEEHKKPEFFKFMASYFEECSEQKKKRIKNKKKISNFEKSKKKEFDEDEFVPEDEDFDEEEYNEVKVVRLKSLF